MADLSLCWTLSHCWAGVSPLQLSGHACERHVQLDHCTASVWLNICSSLNMHTGLTLNVVHLHAALTPTSRVDLEP